MANYPKYRDADFARFEPPASAYERSAARKIVEMPPFEEQKKPQMQLVEKKKKTVAQARREMRLGARQAAKVLVIAICLLSMFAALLYGRLRVDELTRQVNSVSAKLEEAQGENVRLNMQLDSMISLEKVENFAKNDLGMTKVEGYQIEYIDLTGTDSITVSGGKSAEPKGETSITEKLLEYLKAE